MIRRLPCVLGNHSGFVAPRFVRWRFPVFDGRWLLGLCVEEGEVLAFMTPDR